MFRYRSALACMVWGGVLWTSLSAVGSNFSPECRRYLRKLSPWASLDERVALLFQSNELPSFQDAWPHLKRNAQFRDFLEERDIPLNRVPRSRQVALVNEFFRKRFLPHYQGRELAMNQELSLLEGLGTHGVDPGARTGRQALTDLSARNRERIEKDAPELDVEVVKEARSLVDSLRVFPVHNTHHIDSLNSDMPLVSSRDIQRLGLPGGINSQESFNREFMRSDDQVFFHATLARTSRQAVDNRTMYGKHGLVLKENYARDHGWVSPFVMYVEHLSDFGRVCCPREAARVSERAWEQVRKGGTGRIPVDELMAILEIKNRLGDYDFTHSDYQSMIRNLLLRSLSEQKRTDAAAFARSMERLKSDDPADIYGLTRELVFNRYGLPESFEIKVPVAVPRDSITAVPSL